MRDPEVHFDGERIVFAKRRHIGEDYSIWEIHADGTGLRRLTSADGVADFDPFYLPDDSIAFSSTREPKYNQCSRDIGANLFRMAPDGANIHQVSKNNLFDSHGTLMPDGRILYRRWEYVDRNFGDAHRMSAEVRRRHAEAERARRQRNSGFAPHCRLPDPAGRPSRTGPLAPACSRGRKARPSDQEEDVWMQSVLSCCERELVQSLDHEP